MFAEGTSQSAIARISGKNYNTIHSYICREAKKAENIMMMRDEETFLKSAE